MIGFLVVDDVGKVVGIVINCDMWFVILDDMFVLVMMIFDNLVML